MSDIKKCKCDGHWHKDAMVENNDTYLCVVCASKEIAELRKHNAEQLSDIAKLSRQVAELKKAQEYGQRHDNMNDAIALDEQRIARRKKVKG